MVESKTYDSRKVRRRYTFIEDIVPADVFEERLSLDFLSILFGRTQSAVGISSQQLAHMISDEKPLER